MGPSDDFSKEMRRTLRKKLKEDLIKVQSLSWRLEERAKQLLQSRTVPSFSDAQFSGRDFAVKGGGKEVTSQLNPAVNGLRHNVPPLPEQQLFGVGNGSLAGAELIGGKRTPKVSEVYKKSEFQMAKDKVPFPVKSNAKLSQGNEQAAHIRNKPLFTNNMKMQCRSLLKKLMDHEDGWIFNEPVDAVKLGLSDYNSVVKKPMDLGTIKGGLDKRKYRSLSEFEGDVRLTFNNAMSFNPPGNDVHQSAKILLMMFERQWDVLKERLSETNGHGEVDVPLRQGPKDTRTSSETNLLTYPLRSQPGSRHTMPEKRKAPAAKSRPLLKPATKMKSSISEAPAKQGVLSKSPLTKTKPSTLQKSFTKSEAPFIDKAWGRRFTSAEKAKKIGKPKVLTKAKATVRNKVMTYEEKVRLQTLLGQLPQHKLEELIYSMKERISNISQEGDEIEVDLDSFDDDTLWELHQRASNCLKNLQKSPVSRKRPRDDNSAGKTGKRQKGPPAVVLEQNVMRGKRSSSESASSTESDPGNSSTSGSDR